MDNNIKWKYIKWFVGIFNTSNGKRIGICQYIDDEELEQAKERQEEILVHSLTAEEADKESFRLVKELNIPMFNNNIDLY